MLDDTDATLFRISIALVRLLEARLYEPDHDKLKSTLEGNDAGALAVWRRSMSHVDPAPPKDRIYAQYAIHEAAIFTALDEQNAWWKDVTLRRLLDRELS